MEFLPGQSLWDGLSAGRCYPTAGSRNFIHRGFVGDPAQSSLLNGRREAVGRQDLRRLRILDHRLGGKDSARLGETLDARRHVDGLAEIILPIVKRHREAGTLVNADLE